MKKLFVNSIVFIFLLLILLNVIGLFLPKYHGNSYYANKFDTFSNSIHYNTIILGSSRMYRQFNPSILNNSFKKQDIQAYNMGAPATHQPEFYYLYEELLKDAHKRNLRYVFLELEPLFKISLRNLTTSRNTYWMNLNQINYANNYVNSSNYNLLNKFRYKASYSFSYIWELMGFQNPKQLVNEKFNEDNQFMEKEGFRSLDMELTVENNKAWIARNQDFLLDTTVIETRLKKSNQQLVKNGQEVHLNKFHLNKLQDLIKCSKEKGIHLIFVVPPKLKEYNELYALLEYIPDENFIDISSPEKYPSLYLSKNTFDVGHLNQNGARLFTNYIVDELRRKKIIL